LEEEEAQMLAVGANLRLGLKHPSGDAWAVSPVPEWISWLLPSDIPRVSCGVQLYENLVELSVPPQGAAHVIELPETNPLFLEVSWSEGSTLRIEQARLQYGVPTTVELSAESITFRTALGETYRLSPESIQSRFSRVRPPRAHITYEMALGDAIERKEVPFVIGVLGNFAGKPSEPLPGLRDRRFIEIDRDNFNEVLSALRPRLELRVDSKLTDDGARLGVELSFRSLADFEPDRLVQQIEPLRKLVEARRRLSELLLKLDGNDRLEELLRGIVNNKSERQDLGAALGLNTTGEGEEQGG
jgi:type VI secretion system protein ImpB